MKTDWKKVLEKESGNKYVIPRSFREDMRVPGIIFIGDGLIGTLYDDEAPAQVVNVATLPGIVSASIALPDIHYGYGFPIGGVAAMRLDDGVISPGGVGFDINCGVRLLRTSLKRDEVVPKAGSLCSNLFALIPCGVGSKGDIRITERETRQVLEEGAGWAVRNGNGWEEDTTFCEENGAMRGADAGAVSARAVERGRPQLGTLGSGNHFIEVQYVDEVYDAAAAGALGFEEDSVAVMIHSGSRGLGAQVCQDYIGAMKTAAKKYGIDLPDGQLACAPVESPEGRRYFGAMAAAANYAWANRQCLAHLARQAFVRTFKAESKKLGMTQVYDVAHNIAKIEEHEVGGRKMKLCVHRKGATRAFPPNHPDVPAGYAAVGQPALVPGDMGRASYVLRGTPAAMKETFGSICHGAGRLKSRSAAKRELSSQKIVRELEDRGIRIRAADMKVITEEAPEAYKDVSLVVESCTGAGIAAPVLRLRPMAVIKG
ncbi:MAG: RtcB family protein [bacterium]